MLSGLDSDVENDIINPIIMIMMSEFWYIRLIVIVCSA